MKRLTAFVLDNSLLLVVGTLTALVWANLDHASYERLAHGLHFAINDIAMVFFFALATKEITEATLPGGPLASPRAAAVPLLAAVGGMVVPASAYAVQATLADRADLVRGWAIPCATDIAFSYMVARMIFRQHHPAIPFLLLLAIADDALGLILLAVVYPSGELSVLRLVLFLIPALAIAWGLRRYRVRSFWPYVVMGGGLSWIALYSSGIHPALALVPIVPFMPHGAVHDSPPDTMRQFERWWKVPVQLILFFFGLANAGVEFSRIGPATWMVLSSLVIGKPIGIVGVAWIASRFGLRMPGGLRFTDTLVVGVAAGIGFTVALFFATAAFPPGAILDEAKMGALLSFVAAPLAILCGALLRRRGAAMLRDAP